MGIFESKEKNDTIPKSEQLNRKERKAAQRALKEKEKRLKEEIKTIALNENPNDILEMDEWTAGGKKSAADTLRYTAMYQNGLCEIGTGIYSLSVSFDDISYQIAGEEEQLRIFTKYCELLNSFPHTNALQLTVVNKHRDMENFKSNLIIPKANDGLNQHRNDYNQMLTDKATQGDNSIDNRKYLTVTFAAGNSTEAVRTGAIIRGEMRKYFKGLRCNHKELSGAERVELLHGYFNDTAYSFDYKDLLASGLTTKDYVCPDKFDFAPKNNFEYTSSGKTKYGQTLILKKLPADLGDQLITRISEIECDLTMSLYIRPVAQEKALDLVKGQRAKMDLQKTNIQQKNIQTMYHPGSVPFELQNSMDEADELLYDLQKRNQRLFRVTVLVYTTADSLEDLTDNIFKIKAAAQKCNCEFTELEERQEEGLNSILPLGACHLEIERNLTTAATAAFIPFTTTEILHENGIYYGLNAISNNLIMVDRFNLKNANGVILGVSGGGKSFKAKEEEVAVLLRNPKDEVLIIDPEGEFAEIAKMFDGEVIDVSAGSPDHLNPFDMISGYGDGENPLFIKGEFILSMCEALLGSDAIGGIERSILDRCARLAYEPYFASKENPDNIPTLQSFQQLLKRQPEEAASVLASSMETFSEGTLSVFAHKTNVNINKRLVVYNMLKLGGQLKALGMLVVLDQVWNRLIENDKKGIRTWIYVDEMQVFFDSLTSARYFSNIWARIRKRNGVATGMTQNVERMLMHEEARYILANSEFTVMLSQAKGDREILSDLLNISEEQQVYITDAEEGHGLLRVGGTIIPFIDEFPRGTELYKAMTTKPSDKQTF